MSRGFVKEDDQEEVPLVPPRADLPAGTENLVTPDGMNQLLQERTTLLEEQEALDSSQEKEYRIAFNHLNARLQLLNERIASAKVMDLQKYPQDEVHFGATVTFKNHETKQTQTFQLVGVDEASIAQKKIAFVTPLARALLNKKTGDTAILALGNKNVPLEILEIQYQ